MERLLTYLTLTQINTIQKQRCTIARMFFIKLCVKFYDGWYKEECFYLQAADIEKQY